MSATTPEHSRPHASSGALFVNEHGHALIVNPTYKAYWNLPGGRIDAGETPRAACEREVREELGLTSTIGELLTVAWVTTQSAGEHVYFIFDGGELGPEEQAAITLQESELSEHRFAATEDLDAGLVPPHLVSVWQAALDARGRQQGPAFVELSL